MTYHVFVANILIAVAILIMAGTIWRSNTLVQNLKQSKVEGFWSRTRILIVLIMVLYLFIMITRLLGDATPITQFFAEGPNHALIMNGTFLITSLVLFSMIGLDIQTFDSLFSLIKNDPN